MLKTVKFAFYSLIGFLVILLLIGISEDDGVVDLKKGSSGTSFV